MIILAGYFDSTKFSNDKAANQSASGHTLRIFLYCSSRIVFLFYLTNYSYKYIKGPGKKQELKKQYRVSSIEYRVKKEKGKIPK